MRTPWLLAVLLAGVLGSGCSLLGDQGSSSEDGQRWRPELSMTESGAVLAERVGLPVEAPTYDVRARVDPGSGRVTGTVVAGIPVGREDTVLMRYFAGVPGLDAGARTGSLTVDGTGVDATRRAALLAVPLPDDHGERVEVTVPFSYTLPLSDGGGLLDALTGMGGPADIGLLARREGVLNLGHWFPLWIPPGGSADAEPSGFGDVGNSPPALIRVRLTVPERWTVIDGGVHTHEEREGGHRTVTTEGYGMNDLAVTVARDYVSAERTLGGTLAGVTVRAHGPRDSRSALDGVLDEAVTSLEVLSSAFVDYPWRELDVVSAPLGSGVGGMEWPGATWIEPALFTGGVPGLGGLDDLLGGLEGLQGPQGLHGLEELLGGSAGGLGGLLGGGTGRMLETLRPWTIAHEVGHEWWHVIVGNDSVLDPAVDEPLAQYSACLVLRELEGGDADELCDLHIRSGYEQMRLLGSSDAPAARSTDEFTDSLQYAGVVYGKAAAFYRELEARFGRDRVVAALGAVTEELAFDMVTADELRDALAAELGEPELHRLWHRWMEQSRGDRDLDVAPRDTSGGEEPDGLGGLAGLADLFGGPSS